MDLCKRAGFECKIIAQDWDGMIPGLKAGKFDVIMDGMAITDERKKEIDFTKPYAASPGSFLAPKDSPLAKAPDAGKLINLDKDPKTATPRSRACRRRSRARRSACRSPPPTPISPASISRTSRRSRNTRPPTTATSTSSPAASTRSLEDLPTNMATASKPDAGLAVVGPEFIGGVFGPGEGMGIRKSDADLTAKFDTALAAAIADGTVKKLSEQWFKADLTPR